MESDVSFHRHFSESALLVIHRQEINESPTGECGAQTPAPGRVKATGFDWDRLGKWLQLVLRI